MPLSVLHNCTLIDIENRVCRHNQSVVIKDKLIEYIGSAKEFSESFLADCKTHDLSDKYIIPGLIDSHVHIFEEPDDILYKDFRIDENLDIALKRGMKHLDVMLAAGITTVREMGTIERRNITLRNLARQEINKPELVVSGNPITHSGGHFVSRCRIVDNEFQMQKAVDEELNAGADFIKINNTIKVGIPQKTIEAAVSIAQKSGTFVACHSYTHSAMKTAIEAGVHTLEHVADFNQELIDQMREKGIIPIPTFVAAFDSIPALNPEANIEILVKTIPDASMSDFVEWYNWQVQNLPTLFNAGLEFGIGTDAGFVPTTFDSLHREMDLLCKLGATPWQVLIAATIGSAKALGKDKEMGIIKKGMAANIVVLDYDPTLNIKNSKSINSVVLMGKFIPSQSK